MAYVKPGVEITQEQRTQTPVLTTPDLEAVVVANGYWIQNLSWDNPDDPLHHSVYEDFFYSDGNSMEISISGINSTYYDVTDNEELVYIDLLGVSGPDTGIVKHLKYGDDFSVPYSTNKIILSGLTTASGISTSSYQVRVGYRAHRPDCVGLNIISSLSDIEFLVGSPVSWNPLAFGAVICQANAASRIYILGVDTPTSPATETIDAINNQLTLKEIYAIAPMTHRVTGTELIAHCNQQSLPTKKKERIAFYNKQVSYPAKPSSLTTIQKATIAEGIRDSNAALASKRLFSIHPDSGYVLENRHVSTIKPTYIAASFAYMTDINFTLYGPYAKLINDIVVGPKLYKAGTEITEAVWLELINAGWGGASGYVTVYAPVPGFYYAAQAAGQAIGTAPEQPLTNVPGTGFAQTHGSQDVFGDDELNTMAEGGTWIMTQLSESGPIFSRHQMSTDITSIAKREMSITKAIDYTSKFIRKGLVNYIGKNNITPGFLRLVETILNGTGRFLVTDGVLGGFKVNSVTQDSISKDTINAEIEIAPKYPVNYIKITLVF